MKLPGIRFFWLCWVAFAAVGSDTQAAQIRAFGDVRTNLSTFTDTDTEPSVAGDPFTRSKVAVSRAGSDFAYASSADIGLLEMKVFGQLSSADAQSSIEIALLSSSARIQDTISLATVDPLTPYEVTFELDVDGVLDFDGGAGRAQASLNTGPFSGQFDSWITSASGLVDETLSVTRTFQGDVDVTVTTSLFLNLFEIGAGANISGQLDNTATLRVILPQGVSIAASESGTFNQVVVPLPPAWPLVLGPLVVLRARKQHRAP